MVRRGPAYRPGPNPLADLIHTNSQLPQLLRLKARAHDAHKLSSDPSGRRVVRPNDSTVRNGPPQNSPHGLSNLHVAAYLPGRVHRAVPSHKDRQVALRRSVAARNQARRLPHDGAPEQDFEAYGVLACKLNA
jgi:hypothetical protein